MFALKVDLEMEPIRREVIAVRDARGIRLLEGEPSRLAALNSLGSQGWIISDFREIRADSTGRGRLYGTYAKPW
jgi:hypothetical protein